MQVNQNGLIRDLQPEQVTKDNYIVPKSEERFYHVKLQVPQYDERTGKSKTRPFIQKFGIKQFETNVRANLKQQGYVIEILHDPNDYIKGLQTAAAERADTEDLKHKEDYQQMLAEAKAQAVKEFKEELEKKQGVPETPQAKKTKQAKEETC